MESNNYISCPVSVNRVDESVVRTVSIFVFTITLIILYTGNYFISGFLAIDFAIRAFTNGNASPLKIISKKIAEIFKFKKKPIDAAPKKFAAGLGLLFSTLIALFQILHLTTFAQLTGGILIFCALLEGLAGICLGCIVYSILILPLRNKLISNKYEQSGSK